MEWNFRYLDNNKDIVIPCWDISNFLLSLFTFKARSLCSLLADNDQDCFLIGTQSLVTSNNQVHLVKLQEDTNTLCPQVCIYKILSPFFLH